MKPAAPVTRMVLLKKSSSQMTLMSRWPGKTMESEPTRSTRNHVIIVVCRPRTSRTKKRADGKEGQGAFRQTFSYSGAAFQAFCQAVQNTPCWLPRARSFEQGTSQERHSFFAA